MASSEMICHVSGDARTREAACTDLLASRVSQLAGRVVGVVDLVVLPSLVGRGGAYNFGSEVRLALHRSGYAHGEELIPLFGKRVRGVVPRHLRLELYMGCQSDRDGPGQLTYSRTCCGGNSDNAIEGKAEQE